MKLYFTTQKFLYLFLSILLLTTLCSFSSVPTPSVQSQQPPVERKAENQRQKRLNKRYNHLHKRFDKAKNSKKRLHLQRKIRQVERQQADEKAPVMGIIGMILGTVTIILSCAAFVFLFSNITFASLFFFISLILSITGLVLSIISIAKENPDMKGFGIAGAVTNGIALFITIVVGLVLFVIAALGS